MATCFQQYLQGEDWAKLANDLGEHSLIINLTCSRVFNGDYAWQGHGGSWWKCLSKQDHSITWNGSRWKLLWDTGFETIECFFLKAAKSELPLGHWESITPGRSAPFVKLKEEGKVFEAYKKSRPLLQLFARPAAAGGFVVEAVNLGGERVAEVSVQADSTWEFLMSNIDMDANFFCDGEDMGDTPDEVELQHTSLSRAFQRAEEAREEEAPAENSVADQKGSAEEAADETLVVSTQALSHQGSATRWQTTAHLGATGLREMEMRVGTRRSASFYIRAASSCLAGLEAREASEGRGALEAKVPVDVLRISGLGEAISTAVAAAAHAEAEGCGEITKIETTYGEMASGRSCARIMIVLKRK